MRRPTNCQATFRNAKEIQREKETRKETVPLTALVFAGYVVLRWLVCVTCIYGGGKGVDVVPPVSQCNHFIAVNKNYRHCTFNKKEQKRMKENKNDDFLCLCLCVVYTFERKPLTTGLCICRINVDAYTKKASKIEIYTNC